MFTSSTKREVRHLHVVVVQWRQRNVQKSVMQVRSCLYSAELFFAVLDAFTWSLLKALFTLYQLAFAQARKLFRIGFPFIHKVDDFGAISVTERSYAASISNTVERHMSNRFWPLHFFGPRRRGSEYVVARTGTHWDEINFQEWDLGLSSPSWLSANRSGTMFDVCGLLVQVQGSGCLCYT